MGDSYRRDGVLCGKLNSGGRISRQTVMRGMVDDCNGWEWWGCV